MRDIDPDTFISFYHGEVCRPDQASDNPCTGGTENNPPTCKNIHRHVKIFGNFGNNRVWVINVSTPGRNINFTLTTTQGNELLILVYEQGRIYSTGIPHTTIDRGSEARLGNLFPPVGSNCAARM